MLVSIKQVNNDEADLKARKNAYADEFKAQDIKEDELIYYLNRNHFSTSSFKGSYRDSEHIETIAPLIKLDIDEAEHYEDVLRALEISGYKHIITPSASYTDDALHKLHIIVFTDDALTKECYNYQVDRFLQQVGINPQWIDYRVSTSASSYFAPYRTKFQKINDDVKKQIKFIDDEVSEFNDGMLVPIIKAQDVPNEFKKSSTEVGYISPTSQERGKVYKLDELHSSDKATYLNINGFIPYRNEIVSIKDVQKEIFEENNTNKVYSGLGCPACNSSHTADPITTPYSFAYISKYGEINIKCTGNACSDKPLYIIPNKEIKELYDVENGTQILSPIVGNKYLINSKECECINKYNNSYNFEYGYKYVRQSQDGSSNADVVDDDAMFEAIERHSEANKQVKAVIPSLEQFKRFQMTKEKREQTKNQVHIIDGLIVENYHTYLMGNAGAGKTTILLHLCFEMVKKGYRVIYFYLDGALDTASKVSEEIERLDYEEKFNLLVDGTMQEYTEILESFINSRKELNKTVFILDTFKFLTANINDKNANKKAMHLIKKVCSLGSTFVSLGHTNKDGENFSGTAEIEQDSDAVLKINGHEENNITTSTIKKGGRCRYGVKETSFTFEKGDVFSVKGLDEVFDAESKADELKALKDDMYIIEEIKRTLRLNPSMLQKDVISDVNEKIISSTRNIKRVIIEYEDKHWKKSKSTTKARGYEYSVIDDSINNSIKDIQAKIGGR